jgi:hypothetical protein
MAGEPFSWNVVLMGAWNTAILSPDGVRKRLFQLPAGTPVDLQVAIDRPGHLRISHEGVMVIPMPSRLEVVATNGTEIGLTRAAGICQRAISELPETPMTAAGVNIRYRFEDLPDDVLAQVAAPLDDALALAEREIVNLSTRRTVKFDNGVVNLTVSCAPVGTGTVEFNFHRDSGEAEELSRWIGRTSDFVNGAKTLAEVIGIRDDR